MKYKYIGVVIGILILCFIGYLGYRSLIFNPNNDFNVLFSNQLITDVYTDKARYSPGESVKIEIEINKNFDKDKKGDVYVYYKHLNNIIKKEKLHFDLKANKGNLITSTWNVPKDDYTGYSVEVYAVKGAKVLDNKNTAVDVSSDWSKFPRYGYIASFPKQTKEKTKEIINILNKYHIDGLQFYDWQYEHHKPLAGTVSKPDDKWMDIANRETSGVTVKDYIDIAHSKNMMAANYNLMFGAYYGYEQDGVSPKWGLYKDDKHEEQDFHPLPSTWATSQLFLFNPANKEWQNYIFSAEKAAMDIYNFDVWHVDTLGERGTLYDYDGNNVELSSGYADFLNCAKKSTGKRILFNPVNGYGENEALGNVDVDFLYKEVWPSNYSSYSSLKDAVDNSRELSKGKKAVVLAAYINHGLSNGSGNFNEAAVRLADASIFAAGGAHIELGDGGMLCNEYFPNNNLIMTDSLKAAMRHYYDFSVAYENLLRDGAEDSKNKIESNNVKISEFGDCDTVWAYAKEKKECDILHLINLTGVTSEAWVDDNGECKTPKLEQNFKIKYYCSEKAKDVWMASPDINDGKITYLKYKNKKDNKGNYIEITIPKLKYWNMVCIDKK